MRIPYRHTEKIKLNQYLKAPLESRIDSARVVLILLPERPGKAQWAQLAHGDILKSRYQQLKRQDKHATRLVTDLPNKTGSRVILQTIDPQNTTFELLTTARKLAAAIRTQDPAALLIQLAGFKADEATRLVETMTAAILASVCPMPAYQSDPAKAASLARIDFYGLEDRIDLAAVQAEIMGNHLARWLSVLPPNVLTPAAYRKFVTQLAKTEGWQMTFLNTKALARKKAGAFLSVCQGSPVDDMNGMHEDMQGSAVALGTLLALSRLKVNYPVDCWLALAENHIGSKAYKPNDVVTACNGTSIEVKHTDAEGRMVLADTLALASKEKPHVMIDYATLTGACIYSLSSRYSGVFSNRDSLHAPLTTAGRDSGERVWPFPLDKDFDDSLKSDIADTLQCTLEGDADHILAARFLKRFVDDDIHWVHVDLAASNHKGGLGHIATDTTGFGVRYTLNLLLQQSIMENTWN